MRSKHRDITLAWLLQQVYDDVPQGLLEMEPTLVAVEVEGGMVQITDAELEIIQQSVGKDKSEPQPVLVLKPREALYAKDET